MRHEFQDTSGSTGDGCAPVRQSEFRSEIVKLRPIVSVFSRLQAQSCIEFNVRAFVQSTSAAAPLGVEEDS